MTEERIYKGADWIETVLRLEAERRGENPDDVKMSDFGRKVADLLGDLFYGIYHIDKEALHPRVDWSNERHIEIVIHEGQMATYDFGYLTRFVVLCHDRCIRGAIQGAAPRYLRLIFHPRKREGTPSETHPTMEEHIEMQRSRLGHWEYGKGDATCQK